MAGQLAQRAEGGSGRPVRCDRRIKPDGGPQLGRRPDVRWGLDPTPLVARVPGALHRTNVYQPLGGSERGYEPLRIARVSAMRPRRAKAWGRCLQLILSECLSDAGPRHVRGAMI